jgi:hypothetical protein
MQPIQDRLVSKSIEAFIMGLELYNKPTIKYRIEGFSFFVCNAWELMLKAKLVNDGKSIYYENSDRTLALASVLRKVYTDRRQPLRVNLQKIIDLRNTSTHFVTEDYESIYAPLFQACVFNYIEELARFHDEDITQYIAQNFLTLSASMKHLENSEIGVKYDPETAERLILLKDDVEVTSDTLENTPKFTIPVKHSFYIAKKKDEADLVVAIDKSANAKVKTLKVLKDPNDTHKIGFRNLIVIIADRIIKDKIPFEYSNSQGAKKTAFTQNILTLFIDFYDIKADPNFCFAMEVGKSTHYKYSQPAVDFILEQIKNDPSGIVAKLKREKSESSKPA